MSELPSQEPSSAAPDQVDEPDGSVAHPVPIDSPTARDGDGGTPADSLPPPLGT